VLPEFLLVFNLIYKYIAAWRFNRLSGLKIYYIKSKETNLFGSVLHHRESNYNVLYGCPFGVDHMFIS